MERLPVLPMDGDDLYEFSERVEAAFDVRFTHDDPCNAVTLGELAEDLRRRIGPDHLGACLTSMSFYRLRRALGSRITPGTLLAELGADREPRQFAARTVQGTQLNPPRVDLRPSGHLASLVATICVFVFVFASLSLAWPVAVAAIAVFPAAVLVVLVDRGRLPAHLRTAGDLARHMAAMNVAELREQGGRLTDTDLLNAVIAIAAEEANLSPAMLGAQTRLNAA